MANFGERVLMLGLEGKLPHSKYHIRLWPVGMILVCTYRGMPTLTVGDNNGQIQALVISFGTEFKHEVNDPYVPLDKFYHFI